MHTECQGKDVWMCKWVRDIFINCCYYLLLLLTVIYCYYLLLLLTVIIYCYYLLLLLTVIIY